MWDKKPKKNNNKILGFISVDVNVKRSGDHCQSMNQTMAKRILGTYNQNEHSSLALAGETAPLSKEISYNHWNLTVLQFCLHFVENDFVNKAGLSVFFRVFCVISFIFIVAVTTQARDWGPSFSKCLTHCSVKANRISWKYNCCNFGPQSNSLPD